ncbi:MAG: molybdopterin dinucleotide-binding region [Myxococcales bacterium]|nr:molybdopterin dinucleotide-binding region [Myxococcales bacterium]
MAECHPVGFRWVMKAKERGAKIIHVDPRYTRTSAVADQFVPIRIGSDIAFLGGLVRYVIENERYFRDYVVPYTNAATIITEEFRDTEDLDGLFSGFQDGAYDEATWTYQGIDAVPAAGHKELFASRGAGQRLAGLSRVLDEPRDPTLQHPRCVFQILRRHFARYTPEMVARTCGVPEAAFLRVAESLCENSGRERTSAICYAVGWTQHSVGVQYIRTASILQLLLGNIGRPGGGILALRGHASIQGSTDIPTLFDLLPGYLPMPHVEQDQSIDNYLRAHRADSGWWSEMPKYLVSLLKAWFGDAATRDNGYLFEYLPHLSGSHSHLETIAEMADGKVNGYFVIGENPVVGTVGGPLQRKGLRKLDWLVVCDFMPTETAEFWRVSPEHERGAVRAEDIATEVFFFPAAAHTEKSGTFTNTQRLLQWHHKAVEAPGDARSDLWFAYQLGLRLKQRYASSTRDHDRPIHALTWDYPTEGAHGDPSSEAVLREINGFSIATGDPVSSFTELADDGSTACGCWIYSGCYAHGINQPARRKPGHEQSWVAPEWGWAWPDNRRILYNRASAAPDGTPWSERKRYVWWDAAEGAWVGHDRPDFIRNRPPDYRPGPDAHGIATLAGDAPFLLQADGRGWLFAPTGIVDGPLPAHYEPEESAIDNPIYRQQCNPARVEWQRRDNPYHAAARDRRFPYALTTFRLTEHHTSGAMSRWLSWLSELQPALFCEVSPELAAERQLVHGDWATLRTARAEIECRVLVTRRNQPLQLDGKTVHQIAIPYHWGALGRVVGDVANDLFALAADPNVNIPESKATTVDIVRGRLSRDRTAVCDGSTAIGGPDPGRDAVTARDRVPRKER